MKLDKKYLIFFFGDTTTPFVSVFNSCLLFVQIDAHPIII